MQNRVYSQGAELTEAGTSFRTWATGKKTVAVAIHAETGEIQRELELQPEPEGYYSVVDPAAGPGTLYKYRLDGQLFPDPASRFQPQGVHGPSQVVDSRGFLWQDQDWTRTALKDLVIYELHLGTFTAPGTFAAVSEHFDHFRKTGLNAIQIMPVADFPGDHNWGYDGVASYAPSRAYGSPDDLRSLVNQAHLAGLTVILDVVYNHLGPDGNYLGAFSPRYFNQRHATPWGDAFNLDSADAKPVRRYFAENPVYWMREFHFDGFRLDATQAIPDESEKHLIQEIAERVQERGGLVICEDPRNERQIILPRQKNGYGCDAVWADDFHHVVRVQMTGENEGYLGYFKGSIDEIVQTIREGWLFTGQTQKDGLPRGTSGKDLAPERFIHCISNHDQIGNRAFGERLNHVISPSSYRAASALLLLGPYTPMLFMGQEWAAETPFLFFTDHAPKLGRSVTEGRRREFEQFSEFSDPEKRETIPDPQAKTTFSSSKLNWEELKSPKAEATLRLYRTLIEFRREKLGDRRRTAWKVEQLSGRVIVLRYNSILVLVQLIPAETRISLTHKIFELPPSFAWTLHLSTNSENFGGAKEGQLDLAQRELLLADSEAIILEAKNIAEPKRESRGEK